MLSNKIKTSFNLFFLVRFILGSIFIFAGIYKLLNSQVFENALNNYN